MDLLSDLAGRSCRGFARSSGGMPGKSCSGRKSPAGRRPGSVNSGLRAHTARRGRGACSRGFLCSWCSPPPAVAARVLRLRCICPAMVSWLASPDGNSSMRSLRTSVATRDGSSAEIYSSEIRSLAIASSRLSPGSGRSSSARSNSIQSASAVKIYGRLEGIDVGIQA